KTKKTATTAAVRGVLERLCVLAEAREALLGLRTQAGLRSNRRSLRELVVPGQVILVSNGRQSTQTSSLTRAAGNEFATSFSDLKESVTYTVRGEDYVTPPRTITVVERPRVERLETEEERPAYLFYRPTGDVTMEFLRGRRQRLERVALAVSGE